MNGETAEYALACLAHANICYAESMATNDPLKVLEFQAWTAEYRLTMAHLCEQKGMAA